MMRMTCVPPPSNCFLSRLDCTKFMPWQSCGPCTLRGSCKEVLHALRGWMYQANQRGDIFL
jgi:hypothetical protein